MQSVAKLIEWGLNLDREINFYILDNNPNPKELTSLLLTTKEYRHRVNYYQTEERLSWAEGFNKLINHAGRNGCQSFVLMSALPRRNSSKSMRKVLEKWEGSQLDMYVSQSGDEWGVEWLLSSVLGSWSSAIAKEKHRPECVWINKKTVTMNPKVFNSCYYDGLEEFDLAWRVVRSGGRVEGFWLESKVFSNKTRMDDYFKTRNGFLFIRQNLSGVKQWLVMAILSIWLFGKVLERVLKGGLGDEGGRQGRAGLVDGLRIMFR